MTTRTTSAVSEETLAAFAEYGTATIYEAAGRSGLINIPLTQLTPGSRVCGPARIAACGQDDNRAVHEVMAYLQPGDVLVLTMPEPAPVALLGELLATQAAAQGASGVLVDAASRDTDELRELGLPTWTRFIRVAGATKKHRGAIDVPVEVGGTHIESGDAVVLDADGAAVVPAARSDEVLDAARARVQKETAMAARLRAGELSYDIYGMRSHDTGGD